MINKKALYLAVLLLSAVFASGCETVIGAAHGVDSIAKGAQEDVKNLWSFLRTADARMQKNAW